MNQLSSTTISAKSAEARTPPLDDFLSLQLYSLRGLGGIEAQLDAAAKAGFRLVETAGGQLADPKHLRSELDARSLAAPTGHVGIVDLRDSPQRVADAAAEVGIRQLFMPAYPPAERGRTAASWRRAGEELGNIAAFFIGQNIGLGYHNHFWELDILDDGRTALESFFDGAKGSPLLWQADVAWLARAGVDPIAWMDRYAGLLASAHVKDQAPTSMNTDEDGWTDVGAGVLDWDELWTAARNGGAEMMVVEHDNPKDPAGFAVRSHAFLVELNRRVS